VWDGGCGWRTPEHSQGVVALCSWTAVVEPPRVWDGGVGGWWRRGGGGWIIDGYWVNLIDFVFMISDNKWV
jgi:hypothetical protein